MSSIPSSPPPGQTVGPTGAAGDMGFNENAVYGSLIAQANALGDSITGYYEEVSQQTQGINQINYLVAQLNNLKTECDGSNGTVNTSSVQAEMTALGVDLPNPANASQIGDAVDSSNEIQ